MSFSGTLDMTRRAVAALTVGRGGPRARLLGLGLAGALAAGTVGGAVAGELLGGEAPSPATGHAEVIAHGVVALPEGDLAWRVAAREAAPAG